ncbi:oxygen-insensitive NAD(P)H nitroreductase [Acinetobacter brisouii]|uniref:oxygen-insensitive NAD(P)H nitroreductase n=1 Tax=Acinetobacter brisouii TaxID=396323 RepID=UPI0012504975|nr:oxygen-insensitive NAD(P)H nitroreductase [Acinetobacter brisouii]
MDLLNLTQQRYTTKAYDPNKKIPQDQIDLLLEVLRLAPSSINIQPWHFIVAQSPEAKQRIAKCMTGKYAYNAPKVLDSSHTIVLCTRTDVTEEYLEHLVTQDDVAGRFKDEATKQSQRETRAGYIDYYRNEKGNIQHWMETQTFIALGELLLAAPILGIDATPIGGFDDAAVNQEFDLVNQGFHSSVVLTLGYRSEKDFNAKLPKSRLSKAELFTIL